jgi:hypothetical protein
MWDLQTIIKMNEPKVTAQSSAARPKLKQIAIFGPHTNEIGVVSAIRKNGFYVRHTTGFPTVPGGRKPAYSSRFFRFEEIGERGFEGKGVTLSGEETR